MLQPHPAPYVYSAKDWNDWAVEQIAKLGKTAPALDKYLASKTLADRATWEFLEKNKPAFEVVNIMPTYVYGPVIHEVCPSRNSLYMNVTLRR